MAKQNFAVKFFIPFWFLGIMLLAGCASRYARQVSEAANLWASQDIQNYNIVIRFYESFAIGITTEREVTVKMAGLLAPLAWLTNALPLF